MIETGGLDDETTIWKFVRPNGGASVVTIGSLAIKGPWTTIRGGGGRSETNPEFNGNFIKTLTSEQKRNVCCRDSVKHRRDERVDNAAAMVGGKVPGSTTPGGRHSYVPGGTAPHSTVPSPPPPATTETHANTHAGIHRPLRNPLRWGKGSESASCY